MENEKDQALWKIAQKRVGFKRHLFTYIIVNLFLWCLWFIGSEDDGSRGFPWPVWCTLGWGIGLFFNFAGAYLTNNPDAVEKEFNKLKNKT